MQGAEAAEGLPESLNCVDKIEGSALTWATAHCLAEASRALLKCDEFTKVNERRASDGCSALHLAAAQGLQEVVSMLLLHTDFTGVADPDADGFTALHGAAFHGHTSCVKLLLEHPDFTPVAVMKVGVFDIVRPELHWTTEARELCDLQTALHMAAVKGHAEVCQLLLAAFPEGTDGEAAAGAVNRVGATALHMAARGGHGSAVEVLLQSERFRAVNAKDIKGFTALHWGALQATPWICNAILDRKDFLVWDAKDLRGRTAMDIAEEGGRLEVQRCILTKIGVQAMKLT